MKRKLWGGTFGSPIDSFSEGLRKTSTITCTCRRAANGEFQKCHDEFCRQIVWPCSHYAVPDAPKSDLDAVRAFESYAEYVCIHKCFADAIIEFFFKRATSSV